MIFLNFPRYFAHTNTREREREFSRRLRYSNQIGQSLFVVARVDVPIRSGKIEGVSIDVPIQPAVVAQL